MPNVGALNKTALPTPSPSSLLDEILRIVARRYRLPAIPAEAHQKQNTGSATKLAIAIEQARLAVVREEAPNEAVKRLFIDALVQMIHEAMHAKSGDFAFQAMVLQHTAAQVREYASLSAQAAQDHRLVLASINAIAHPAKLQRLPAGPQREALSTLQAFASSAAWSELAETARRILPMPEFANNPTLEHSLTLLLDSAALRRLRRLDVLASDELVMQYQTLRDRHGPRSGSPNALAHGSASQRRGAAVETLTRQTIEVLAQRLNEAEGASASYRVVSSMRVPPLIPASHERAKSEWDVVLLREAKTADATTVWDVCLLVEAKASVDAATTDLPRLLRGVRLLAQTDKNLVYQFQTQEGVVCLHGASLSALTSDEADIERTVLYCCDAPVETAPRLLGAASRMQLLSIPACLEFASKLTQKKHANPEDLEPVWHQLLESPQWRTVLHQYPMLRQVRELMVHPDDLLVALGR